RWPALFGIACLAYMGCLAVAIAYLWGSYFGHAYAYLPTPKQFETHWAELEEYHRKYNLEADLTEYSTRVLIEHYIEAIERNTAVNDLRSIRLHKANTFVLWAIIAG